MKDNLKPTRNGARSFQRKQKPVQSIVKTLKCSLNSRACSEDIFDCKNILNRRLELQIAEECETANTFHLMMTQINTLGINCGLLKMLQELLTTPKKHSLTRFFETDIQSFCINFLRRTVYFWR